ncbi:MAG: HAMP domain-containing histidine kinase [Nitrospirae bacterium]|nr:HAMP domain-containing histidine kinase [Candidatus Manganitrophaceae bacterium]
MISKLSFRKRLVIFGAAWLIVCTGVLAYYLISQAEWSLLESAVQRSKLLANHLADQAGSALFSGNQEALESLIKSVKEQPDILGVRILYKDRNYGGPETAPPAVGKSIKSMGSNSSLIEVNHVRAIESYKIIGDISHNAPISEEGVFRKVDGGPPIGRAIVSLSVEPIYDQIDALRVKAITFLIAVLIIGILMAWAASGEMISPLRQLAAHVSSMADVSETGADGMSSTMDEVDLVRDSFLRLKESLDERTAELALTRFNLEDNIRKHITLEARNSELEQILNLKSDLILQLSHDIMTPLGALSTHIANFNEISKPQLTKQEKNRLLRMLDLCERLKRMLGEVLEFAVRETGKIELRRRKVDLGELAGQVLFALESMQEEMKVRCNLANDFKGKFAYADPDHVEQILMNLIHNAIKASPPGSCIVITADENRSQIEIGVKDTGFGVARDFQSKLFEKPVNPKGPNGNGVGLYICRFLVELQGGKIWFKTEDKGSTFFFTLPKCPSKIEAGISDA